MVCASQTLWNKVKQNYSDIQYSKLSDNIVDLKGQLHVA